MKKIKVFILFLLILFCTGITVSASETGNEEVFGKEINTLIDDFLNSVPQEAGLDLERDHLSEGIGFDRFLISITDAIEGKQPELLKFFATVFGFAIVCVVCEFWTYSSQSSRKNTETAVLAVMAASIYPHMYSVFCEVREGLISVCAFFGSAMPALTAITTASGAVKSAGVQAMNMSIVLGAVGSGAVKLLLPLSFCMLALALISSFGEGRIQSISKAIKNIFTFGLGIVSAVSSAIIALQSVIAGASDSAALRAARYAASGLIPVVGSSVSAALSTLAGGLAYAKSTVGAVAIFVLLVLAIVPLITLLLYRLIFSVSVFFLEFVDSSGGVRCFQAFRSAIDAVISVYVMSILVFIIQFIVFMKGGAFSI